MAYDNNTDYMAIMNANQPGSAAYNAAAASRQEKIAAANNQQLTNWGVSVGDATAAKMADAEAKKQALIAAQKAKITADLVNKRNSLIGGINTQLNSTRTALENAKNSAISNLDSQKAKIAPTYYNMRNSASAQSQLNAKSLAEYMANRNQTNSNLATLNEINRQNNLSGQIGTLNNNEAQNVADIEAKRADTANSYENSLASAGTNAAAAISQADQAYANDIISAQSGIESTALSDSIAGINKNMDNYRIDSINERNRQDALTQQDFDNKFKMSQADYQKQKDAIDQAYRDKAFKLEQDVQNRRITVEEAQMEMAKAREKRDADQQTWENNYKNRAFDNNVTQQNADNAYKYAALEASNEKATSKETLSVQESLNNANKFIDAYYVTRDLNGNKSLTMQNKRDIANYIANLAKSGYDRDVINQLAAQYEIDASMLGG